MVESQKVKGTGEGNKQKGRRAGLGFRKAMTHPQVKATMESEEKLRYKTPRQLTVAKTCSLKTKTHKKSVDAVTRKPGLEAKRKWSPRGSPG